MAEINLYEDEFGFTKQPPTLETEVVKRYTFTNNNGISIQVISYGATITSLKIPDNQGQIADIVLGYDNMEGYLSVTNPYFGATIGRVCNRIAKGEFQLNGNDYKLAKNIGENHLHGGFIGFDKFNWSSFINGKKVIMTHVSNDGFEGYPGVVITNVTFELKDDNKFCITFISNVSKPTPINLTNHSYFNLAGHETGYGEIYKHYIALNADKFTVTDAESIPTGELKDVGSTPYDLRTSKELGFALSQLSEIGFDDNFCVTKGEGQTLTFIAEVVHKQSGRVFQVYSDQPGVQLYTANYFPDPNNNIYPERKKPSDKTVNGNKPIQGKNNALYLKHGAFCLETQKYPDAVNHDNFPSVIINPGETYKHELVYKFNTKPIIEIVNL